VSISVTDKTVKDVFEEIKAQTNYSFWYDLKDVNVNRKVNVNVNNETVRNVLSKVLADHDLDFELKGNHIVIMKKTSTGTQTGIPHVFQNEKRISGIIKDEKGDAIIGANVLVKGTSIGTTSDMEGRFSFDVPANAILRVSYIGYLSQEVHSGNRTTLEITMIEDTKSLEEVVVVGYGVQKKETLTGSVTSVKGTDIVMAPVTNVTHSIAGRLPGVVSVTRSGEPGADGSTIRIRGTNTLGDNSALIVVDGIPGRSLDRIDPNSIESISVLKDASAAIYGAQAANGVILITTKRGEAGKPQVTINGNMGFHQPTVLPSLLDAAEYVTALNEVDMYRGRKPRYSAEDIQKFGDGSDPWKYPNTDWFDETFRNWSTQMNVNAEISGGSQFMRYFVSGGAKNQDAIYKNSATRYNQYDVRTNLDMDVNKHIRIGMDVTGRIEDRNYPMGNNGVGDIFRMLMRGKPHTPAYWPNGLPGPDIEYGSNPVVITTDKTGYDRDKRYIFNGNLKLDISIPWVEGLSLTGNAAYDKTIRYEKKFQKPWYLYSWDGQSYDEAGIPVLIEGKKGVDDPNLTQYMQDSHTILLNGLINYEKNIAGIHQINFLIGLETRKGKSENFDAYRRYFASTAIDQLNAGGTAEMRNSGTASHHARLNYFGRVNYGYKGKYLAEFIWRVDGSYIFPKDGRYGFFPGVSLGWRMSEEGFWKDHVPFVSHFKLRASYGKTGNDRISEWQYLTSYAFAANTRNQVFNLTEEGKSLYETRIPNPNVTWEVANQGNVGFDSQFWDEKISVSFDYFDYRRSNILWNRDASVPRSTGLTLPRENIGKVTNRGFDFEVAYRDNIGDVNFQLSLNGGYAKNKIKFWDEASGAPDYQRSTGKPIPTNPSSAANDLYYQVIGVFRDQAHVDSYPHWPGARPGDLIFKDVNDDQKIDANDRVRTEKTNIPPFQGGLGLNLQYKQWSLSALLQGSAGAVRYVYAESGESGNYLKRDFDGRWTPDNIDASKPRIYNQDEYWVANRNTYFLYKSDYIRLKTLELGYNIPRSVLDKTGIQALRFYFSGYNLFTICPDLKDFDPEGSNERRDNYPLSRILNLGLSVTF
jgi:TonB-linked SusC/RagA family outer membrane protein